MVVVSSEEESVQNGTPVEDTRSQRQQDCDALLAALEAHGMGVNMLLLQTPLLLLTITDVLVDANIIAREEIDARLWDKIHAELTRKLQEVEEAELNAPPKPSPFLARATEADLRALSNGRKLH